MKRKKNPSHARQNEILELGMLIRTLPKKDASYYDKRKSKFTQIHRLICVAFDKDIDEIEDELKTKLTHMGIKINS